MQAAFAEHHVENPEFMGIHYMDATSVEECWRLLRQTGKSISFESLAHVPRYSAWLAGQDWTDAYERHRANLQLIGLHDPDRRWVLKNPSHLAALDALMTVYPDALVVVTHRDPVTSVASACSLSAEATAGTSTTFVGETIGRTQLDLLSRSWRSFTSARPAYDTAQFVDVDYDAFVADPVGTDPLGLRGVRPRLDARRRRRRRRDRRRVARRRSAPVAPLRPGRLRPHRAGGARRVLTRSGTDFALPSTGSPAPAHGGRRIGEHSGHDHDAPESGSIPTRSSARAASCCGTSWRSSRCGSIRPTPARPRR